MPAVPAVTVPATLCAEEDVAGAGQVELPSAVAALPVPVHLELCPDPRFYKNALHDIGHTQCRLTLNVAGCA
jgi:hypothetical protein